MPIFNHAIQQQSVVVPGLSAAGFTIFHTPWVSQVESTEGYSCLRFNFRADQPCEISMHQGPDVSNLDVGDVFTVPASTPYSQSVQIVGTVVQFQIHDQGPSSTTFTMQTLFFPVGEALPRALGPAGGVPIQSA